jgi:hypothetical protein
MMDLREEQFRTDRDIHYNVQLIRTEYITSVHPSIVIHCDTVRIDNKMLSNVLIPWFGPAQILLHVSLFDKSHSRPLNIPFLSLSQGCTVSPTRTISSIKIKWCNLNDITFYNLVLSVNDRMKEVERGRPINPHHPCSFLANFLPLYLASFPVFFFS